MKNIFAFALLLSLFSCKQDGSEVSTDLVLNSNSAAEGGAAIDPEDLPVIQFEEEFYSFGDITEGEKVYHRFKFKNTGKSDLIISSASAQCGCTVPKYPKKPIKSGEEEYIEVVFNSEGKEGQQNKQVTIVANTQPSTTVIAIKGNVIAPKTK